MRRFTISLPSLLAGLLIGTAGTAVGSGLLGSGIFPDVPAGSYFDEAVGELNSLGIVKGYDTGKFGPNDYVTRGQVAVMMKRLRDELTGVSTVRSSRSSRSSSSEEESSTQSSSTSSSSSSIAATSKNGVFRFTAGAYTIAENGSEVVISVVRATGAKGEVSVEYETASGTATVDADYEALSGKITLGDGETNKTFTVKIKNDNDKEGNETFKIILKNPTGGALLSTPTSATITITDDESPSSASSTMSVSSSSVPSAGAFGLGGSAFEVYENKGTLTVTVERTGQNKGAVAVNYATSNGTAQAGTHYSSTNGTLNFGDGEATKTFTVSVTDDTSIGGNRSFTVTLSSPTGGSVLGTPASANVTIVDNENMTAGSGSFKFSKEEYDVTEGAVASVTVQRTGGSLQEAKVRFETQNGTAIGGSDFVINNLDLTFRPGESSKTVQVYTANNDDTTESQEAVNLKLLNPTNGTALASPSTATLNIYE